MPRNDKQNEGIRKQRIAQIMEAALDVFAHKGYHTATIADIAKKANIAKGLIYNYFESKEDLLYKLVMHGMNDLIEKFDANHDGVLTDEEMELFINDMFQKIVEKRNYWKLYFSVMLQPDVFDFNFYNKFEEQYQAMVKALIDYFKRKGFENPEMEYLLLHTMSDGIVINFIMNENFPLEGIKNEIIKRYIHNNSQKK
ncbi:MAG: hypothetical protein PWR03_1790 [Tenuifilum sp.]|jgi:AcrR family transcriptional regulator|uniref:TetR/AcrR family transcriptional regulator n=1 Tax=Tenuifilum sp. TaxID=2760880 RepID=UPI0024AC367B|nr:TetR/AcrR family transcriptional regulator [Tenuifilum sp.]MDI3527607.1 hypothetical protein [Tenuifilum sp.]